MIQIQIYQTRVVSKYFTISYADYIFLIFRYRI